MPEALLSARRLPPGLRRAGATFGPAIGIIVAQQILFPSRSSSGEFLWYLIVQGITLGLLTALVALGMALIYRANRVLNFAQGDLGLVPTVLALNLVVLAGFNYFLAAALGLVAAIVVGAVVELAVIRRFFRAPRLILTVATIGLAQLLAFGSLTIPLLWGGEPITTRISMPIEWRWDVGIFPFRADHLAVWVLAPATMAAVALFLRFTAVGVAVRASAERADRASLLGVPVGRLHTYVWIIACALSFLALFLRAGVVGLPLALGSTLGLTVLLTALAALMVGRLTNLPAVVSSAIALGVLEAHVRNNDVLLVGPLRVDLGTELIVAPIMAVIIVIALLLQRRGTTRAEQDETSTWQASAEVRPVPRELRGVPEVRLARLGGLALVAALAVTVPVLPGIGTPGNLQQAAAVLVFAVVILSITVLTGWAGQVSLGQMGFVAFGAAVGAKATTDWGLDLALVLPLAGVAGALLAVVVGLPALRLRGIYLAVTTLAFALFTTGYLLNPRYATWVPQRVERTPLLGMWDYDSPTGQYYLALGVLVLALVAVTGIRRSRTGRVLVALRENERGVQAYGVSAMGAKLTSFALSGFLAAFAGAVLVHQVGRFTLGLFPNQDNLVVFTAAVVGGLGSTVGALLGALFLMGGRWFLSDEWRLLASSMGVLLVLLLVPGGLSGALFRGRDVALRWVARRRDIVVPSLLADVRRLEGEAEVAFEERSREMAATHDPAHETDGDGDAATDELESVEVRP